MLGWVILAAISAALAACVLFYARSVKFAELERRFGPAARRICARRRLLSIAALPALAALAIVHRFHPAPLPLPEELPFPPAACYLLAAILSLPAAGLIFLGLWEARGETLRPALQPRLFGGVYRWVRHPQATGALLAWCAFACLLRSPLPVLISAAAVPLWAWVCVLEQRDLHRRFGADYEAYLERTGLFRRKG
jgi:protein-S-isoprenylcysteine O-methyltransferase Ste14